MSERPEWSWLTDDDDYDDMVEETDEKPDEYYELKNHDRLNNDE